MIECIADIDLKELSCAGIRAIIIDLDNTIVPRDTRVVPENIIKWIGEAKKMGFRLFFVSNNWHREALLWSAKLTIPMIYKAMKPFPLVNRIALRRMGVKASETIVVGDQLLTDVLGAKLAGIKSILVPPLCTTDLPHTLLLRKLEKLFARQ